MLDMLVIYSHVQDIWNDIQLKKTSQMNKPDTVADFERLILSL